MMKPLKKINFVVNKDSESVIIVDVTIPIDIFEEQARNLTNPSESDVCKEILKKAIKVWIEGKGSSYKKEASLYHIDILFSFYYNKFASLRKTIKEAGFQRFVIQSSQIAKSWKAKEILYQETKKEDPKPEIPKPKSSENQLIEENSDKPEPQKNLDNSEEPLQDQSSETEVEDFSDLLAEEQ